MADKSLGRGWALLLVAPWLMVFVADPARAQTATPGDPAIFGEAPTVCDVSKGFSGMAPGGSAVAPTAPGSCSLAWSPDIHDICGQTCVLSDVEHRGLPTNDRVKCATAADGTRSMAIEEYRGAYVSAVDVSEPFPAAIESASAIRLSMQMYIPEDYRQTAGMRLPLGINVGPHTAGGMSAPDQRGSSIRLALTKGRRLAIYSYHFDRTTPTVVGVGQFNPAVKARQYGQGAGSTDVPVPLRQWVTVALEMSLEPPGKDEDSVRISMYDKAGNLLSSGGRNNLTYRRAGDTIGFTKMIADTKINNDNLPSQDQAIFISGYKGYVCD